jgi:hypothetical protein
MEEGITHLRKQIARCRRLAAAIGDADFRNRLEFYEADLEARLQNILESEQGLRLPRLSLPSCLIH